MRETEVEVGEIDRDEHVGPRRPGIRHELTIDGVRAWKDARDLEQAGHREPFEIGDERRAGASQALAAETR